MKTNHLLAATLLLMLHASCQKDNTSTQSYTINKNVSKVEWKGSATDHFHVGSFSVQGHLKANEKGLVKEGNFLIPIASIENYDLENPDREQLLSHLKSADFFNIAVHPNATFSITGASEYNGADSEAIEGANYLIKGNFSMIGQTHEISFPAKVTVEEDSLITVASFKLNRLTWGMNSYNDPAQGLYLLPHVEIRLNIRSARQ